MLPITVVEFITKHIITIFSQQKGSTEKATIANDQKKGTGNGELLTGEEKVEAPKFIYGRKRNMYFETRKRKKYCVLIQIPCF